MAIPRFYTSSPLTPGEQTLGVDFAHHARVLRLKLGDALILFNGDGNTYGGQLMQLDKLSATVVIDEPLQALSELPFELTLAQGLVEPSKMDWIVEKAVELGVTHLVPIAAARSVTKLDPSRAAKRMAHWQALVIAASQQSGRSRLMTIAQPLSLSEHLNIQDVGETSHLLLHPTGGASLKSWCQSHKPSPVCIWIGPEGGWSPQELATLEAAGAQRISFGERVLRTETAGLAVAAAIQALWA